MNKKVLVATGGELSIQALYLVFPWLALLVESVKKYRDHVEADRRDAFVAELASRIGKFENSEWYETASGKEFTLKVSATALNAEHADKLRFLVNALLNGPTLGSDDALRMKFVEMIRQLSKPALQVLAAAVKEVGSESIDVDRVAIDLNWRPALVESCVRELHAVGVLSETIKWREEPSGKWARVRHGGGNSALLTEFSREFAKFVQDAPSANFSSPAAP